MLGDSVRADGFSQPTWRQDRQPPRRTNADKLLTKRKNEALQGKKLPETLRKRVVLFGDVGNDALAYSHGHRRSWRGDESRMKRLAEWFENREAESLTRQEMEKRLSDGAAAEKWAASTYNHYRSLLMLA